ncbi:hypothetical protein Bca101_101477 [Brassica carinata]
MIGRADIEGSKATPLMNAWLPQASYPCDVPPSQTPHLTMSSARSTPPKRVLGLKEGVVTPPPIHGVFFPADSAKPALLAVVSLDSRQDIGFPCPHSVLSWLFDARESSRRAAPSPPPPTRGGPLATLALKQPANSRRVRTGTPSPALRANPFPGYGSILPTSLPTLFHRPEAVHLGDLMRYEYDRRERTRSSGFSRAAECTDTTRRGGALPAADPTSAEPLPGWAGC